MKWYNPQETNKISVYGFDYFAKERKYQRISDADVDTINGLPGRLNILVYNSASGMLAFWGDITQLAVKIKLHYKSTMNHMCYTSQAGFDVYVGDDLQSIAYLATASFDSSGMEYEATINEDLRFGRKLYIINLPLYASVDLISVGVEGEIEPADIFTRGKIAYYGTSITQGASASRPGLCYPSILARELNYQSLNFGFSGNGKGQPEVADILARIDNVDLYVIDYAANVTLELEKETMENLLDTIRARHPLVPIIILGKTMQTKEYHYENIRKVENKRRAFERRIVKARRMQGDNIHYISGKELGITLEETVDGVHLTDSGFAFIAKKLGRKIKEVLSITD